MGSAALLNQVWALLANDATFLSYIGWSSTLSQNATSGATSIVVKSTVNYMSGETVQIADGSGGWVTTTITATGTGTTIPVSALPSSVASGEEAMSNLTPTSNGANKATRLVKEEETDGIVTSSTIPICLLYIRPGKPDVRTPTVYLGKVVLDAYASTGNTARLMVERAQAIMQNWEPPGFFVSRQSWDTSFKTGITGVKGHRGSFDVSYYVG